MRRFTDRIERILVAGLMWFSAAVLKREEGQTFVEYALILGTVVVVMVGALSFLHDKVAGFYTQIATDFGAAIP
jgi:Flp pilus assembly pilin Flp